MGSDQAVRRLRAWHKGGPLPRYSTIHVPVAKRTDALVLAFVRMAGESAPWGVAVGQRGGPPDIFTVPEARNRGLVADMMAKLAPRLLAHFRHPAYSDAVTGPDDPLAVRQLWLPNDSHLDMLHALAYAYTFTKWGDPARAHMLNALGRLCGWLFREAKRPGQVAVMSAASVLRCAYTFPADDLRQAHLGFLLAWLETRETRDERVVAAMQAEQHSMSITLDPFIEREELEPRVERWNDADKSGDAAVAAAEAAQIEGVLSRELIHRYMLTQRAIEIISNDPRPVNAGVRQLETEARREYWHQYIHAEQRRDDNDGTPVFTPSPETDRDAAAAASRYYVHEASEAHRLTVLMHHDDDLQKEIIAKGTGLRGQIISVRDEGHGRKVIPVWVIRSDDRPLSVRPGSSLCVAGLSGREVRVRGIVKEEPGVLSIELEVVKLVGSPHGRTDIRDAVDTWYVGKTVTLLPPDMATIPQLKAAKVWKRSTPGAWLTHSRPKGGRARLPEGVAENGEGPAGPENDQ